MKLDKVNLRSKEEVEAYLKQIGLNEKIESYFEEPNVAEYVSRLYKDFTEIMKNFVEDDDSSLYFQKEIEDVLDYYDKGRPEKHFTSDIKANVKMELVALLKSLQETELVGKELVPSAINSLNEHFSRRDDEKVFEFIFNISTYYVVELIKYVIEVSRQGYRVLIDVKGLLKQMIDESQEDGDDQ